MDQSVKSFLSQKVVGVLSSCDNGDVLTVPVYYVYDAEQDAFFFISKSKSSKISNIKKNNKVFFSVFSEKLPRVYNARCTADLHDIQSVGSFKIIKQLAEIHSTQEYYPSPIASIHEGELILVKLKVLESSFKSFVESEAVQQRYG